jgi:hypothetical protein
MTVGVPARMEIADGPDKHAFLLMQMPTQLDTPFSLLQLRRVLNQKGSNPIHGRPSLYFRIPPCLTARQCFLFAITTPV